MKVRNKREIQILPHLNAVKPRIGQEFATLDDVQKFYNSYAKAAGFSIRNWSLRKSRLTNEIMRKEYVCFKQGKGSIVADKKTKRRRGFIKEDCKARIAVVKSKSDHFVITIFVEAHSHPLSTPHKVHLLKSHRSVSSA